MNVVLRNGETRVVVYNMGVTENPLVLGIEDVNLNYQTTEKYYALVIGNNKYKHLKNLGAAVNDATVIADVLKSKYGLVFEYYRFVLVQVFLVLIQLRLLVT